MDKSSPDFFKVYMPNFSSKTMLIPRAFVRKHFKHAPNSVYLNADRFSISLVDIKHNGKNLYLTDGWDRFVRNHSLDRGDLLIFELIANDAFNVKIYGRNGCKKELVIADNYTNIADSVDLFGTSNEESDEELVGTSYSAHAPKKQKKKSGTEKEIMNKGKGKVQERRFSEDESSNSFGFFWEDSDEKLVRTSYGVPSHKRQKKKSGIEKDEKVIKGKSKALIKKKSRIENRHFTVAIGVSPVCRYLVHIPRLVNLGIKFNENSTLRNRNDKKLWPVKITLANIGRLKITTGWSVFFKEYGLSPKEECHFEIIVGCDNTCRELLVNVVPKRDN